MSKYVVALFNTSNTYVGDINFDIMQANEDGSFTLSDAAPELAEGEFTITISHTTDPHDFDQFFKIWNAIEPEDRQGEPKKPWPLKGELDWSEMDIEEKPIREADSPAIADYPKAIQKILENKKLD